MRREGRTRPPLPLLHNYARRRGLAGDLRQADRRTRRLELAPRVGGTVNRFNLAGGRVVNTYPTTIITGTASTINLTGVDTHGLAMGTAGTLRTGLIEDMADFLVPVPWDMTLSGMHATVRGKPTVNTVLRARRSINDGATFADLTNEDVTVLAAGAARRYSITFATPLNIDEDDVLNFSLRSGGNGGVNLAVVPYGYRR